MVDSASLWGFFGVTLLRKHQYLPMDMRMNTQAQERLASYE